MGLRSLEVVSQPFKNIKSTVRGGKTQSCTGISFQAAVTRQKEKWIFAHSFRRTSNKERFTFRVGEKKNAISCIFKASKESRN